MQPPAYDRQFDFTQHEAENPSEVPPGVSIDAEFNAVAATLVALLSNIARIQRDDGRLKNELVTLEALAPSVLTVLGAGSKWLPRAAWATGTNYAVSDVVAQGTATYVCGVAHVAAALFATDLAVPGRWIKIFDSAGTTPSDGSVTPEKIAPGAILAAAIGFTMLDLAGNIRGGGIQAGTAPLGSLLHAKKAAGDVFAKVERTTDVQGAVGYQILEAVATWGLQMAAGANDLQVKVGATVRAIIYETFWADFVGGVRAIDAIGSGRGVWMEYAGGAGNLSSYDFLTGQWKDLRLRGKDVYIDAGGVNVAKATSTYIDFLKEPRFGGLPMGYLGLPQYVNSASFALNATLVGKAVYSENPGGQVITLPNGAFDTDDVFLIINDGTGAITVDGGTSVVLRFAGGATANNFTIGAGGMAWVKCVKANRYFVRGDGVSAA